jgi:hypothetical protein
MRYLVGVLVGVILALGWLCYTLDARLKTKTAEVVKTHTQSEVVRWKNVYVPVRVETKTREIMERKVETDECASALQLLKDFQ